MIDDSKFWDKAAEKYARSPIRNMEAYEYTLERTRSYLKPDDKVLELGCGTGSTALLLAGSAGHITGTDISPNMIAIASSKANEDNITNADFVHLDAIENARQLGDFDVVLGYNLFHLVPDMAASFVAIHAILPKDGLFTSKTPCMARSGFGVKAILIWGLMRLVIPIMQFFGKAPYVRQLSIGDLEQAIAEAGFEIIETGNYPAGPPASHFVVARKR